MASLAPCGGSLGIGTPAAGYPLADGTAPGKALGVGGVILVQSVPESDDVVGVGSGELGPFQTVGRSPALTALTALMWGSPRNR